MSHCEINVTFRIEQEIAQKAKQQLWYVLLMHLTPFSAATRLLSWRYLQIRRKLLISQLPLVENILSHYDSWKSKVRGRIVMGGNTSIERNRVQEKN
jgi:hypothetical protein